MFSLRPLSSVVLITLGTVAGCKSERPSTETLTSSAATAARSAPATVTVTANDFSFDAPGSVPAGAVTMRLVNSGKELHHAQMVRIEDGKTMDDMAKALKNPGPPPSWVKFVGGPNAVAPGKETHALPPPPRRSPTSPRRTPPSSWSNTTFRYLGPSLRAGRRSWSRTTGPSPTSWPC